MKYHSHKTHTYLDLPFLKMQSRLRLDEINVGWDYIVLQDQDRLQQAGNTA